MIPESAEVRSDQPALSVDPDDPALYDDIEAMTTQCSYIVHWYSCRLDAGHEGLHSPGRSPASQPPAAPSLREALDNLVIAVDALEARAIRSGGEFHVWAEERMLTEVRDEARDALASSDPGSPSESEG